MARPATWDEFGPHRVLGPKQLGIIRADIVAGDEVEQLAIEAEHVREQAAAQRDGVAHDRLEHRLDVGRQGADHAQDRGGRRLLLQCRRQLARARLHLVEQAHVLDRDHGLVGEGRHELDLPVGEGPHIERVRDMTPIGMSPRSIGTPSAVR